MENKELIKNLGTNITMCFLEGCPRADKCVKHLAYEMMGGKKECGSTVMPSSLKENSECNMFSRKGRVTDKIVCHLSVTMLNLYISNNYTKMVTDDR